MDEVPAYPPCGDGEHIWLWIEKTGIATMAAVDEMATALGRRSRDFGWAGLKDAHAVARQWISIAGVAEREIEQLEVPGVRILEVTRHGNKLRAGHLRGNRFDLVLRELGGEEAAASAECKVREGLAELSRIGVPNYFGEQRFGKRGANLDKGLSILGDNPRKAARRMPKPLLKLIVSAVQSEVFNRVLIERISDYERLQTGDVASLHRNGASFLVEDADSEQARCAAFELSPSGPLPGPKTLWAEEEPGRIERKVLESMELDPDVFGQMPHGSHDGARRPLRVPIEGAAVAAADQDALRLQFTLPRGSYATAVLGELLCDTRWFG